MTAKARYSMGLTALLGVILIALWGMTILQATAQEGPVLEGEGVVTYDLDDRPTLDDPVRELIQGSGSDGNCSYTHTFTADPDFRGKIIRREVAYDPDTCRSIFETGTLPLDAAGTDTSAQGNTALSTSTRYVQWKGVWLDPPDWDVNYNQSRLKWRYDPSANTIKQVYVRDCPKYRRAATGWRVSYDSGCSTGYDNGAAYRVESSRTFDNDWFPCGIFFPFPLLGATTWVHDHSVVGKGTGHYTYSTTMGKSGNCAWLLHSETELEVS